MQRAIHDAFARTFADDEFASRRMQIGTAHDPCARDERTRYQTLAMLTAAFEISATTARRRERHVASDFRNIRHFERQVFVTIGGTCPTLLS
jgi:hypothetical protein